MSEYSFGKSAPNGQVPLMSAGYQPPKAQQQLNQLNNNIYFTSKFNSFTSVNNPTSVSNLQTPRRSRRSSSIQVFFKRMTKSPLFIMVKYSIFVNWTLTGFWIIYNSTDYSINAQVISERLSSSPPEGSTINPDTLRVEKESVIYGLIAYTIFTSFVSFFGLVGVCYENLYLTFGLAICYVIYTIVDACFHLVMGVSFGYFLSIMYLLLVLNAAALFYLSYLIRYTDAGGHRRDYVASSERDLSNI